MRISDWSSDVCSSDLLQLLAQSALRLRWAAGDGSVLRRLYLDGADRRECRRASWHCPRGSGAARGGLACESGPRTGGWSTGGGNRPGRSEEHTSELQSLMRISYAVFCLKKKKKYTETNKKHYYRTQLN